MKYGEENDGLLTNKNQFPDISGFGITSIIAASLSLSLVFVSISCLYCLYPRLRKKSFADSDEESRTTKADEMRSINGKANEENATEAPTRKVSTWMKLRPFFQTISATGELDYRLQNSTETSNHKGADKTNSSSSSSSMYDKPPMGDVTLTLVQPATRTGSQSSASSSSTKRKTSFMPESFKLPFDPWLLSDDSVVPQGTDFRGRLEFSVAYAFDTLTLVVKIIKAADLPAMDLSGTSDPFVKCCLLPDRKRKLETKIRRKTLNPSWNETLLFEGLSYDKIQQRVLYMQVMDWDRFSRNDPIGEVCLPLNQIDLTDSQPQWEYLISSSGSNKRGELLISLCYRPVEGKIEVIIKQARNLKPMDIGGTSDPYVKIWHLVRGKRTEKAKTAIIKNCLDPTFEEKFVFDSPMDKLRETQLEVSVMDHDKIGRNDTIGKIYLGTKSNSLEKRHWKEMLTKVRQPVEQWHILKV